MGKFVFVCFAMAHAQKYQTASDGRHIVWGKVEVEFLCRGSCDWSEEQRLLTTFMDNASQTSTDTASSDDSPESSASLFQSTATTSLPAAGRSFCEADSVSTARVGILLRSSSPARLQEAPSTDFSAKPLAAQTSTDTASSDDSPETSASLSQSTATTSLPAAGKTFCEADFVSTARVGMLLRSSSPARLQEASSIDLSANPLAGSTGHEEDAAQSWGPHAEVNGGRRFPTSSPEHVAGRCLPCMFCHREHPPKRNPRTCRRRRARFMNAAARLETVIGSDPADLANVLNDLPPDIEADSYLMRKLLLRVSYFLERRGNHSTGCI